MLRFGLWGILSTVTVGGCAHTYAGARSAPANVEQAKRMPADAFVVNQIERPTAN